MHRIDFKLKPMAKPVEATAINVNTVHGTRENPKRAIAEKIIARKGQWQFLGELLFTVIYFLFTNFLEICFHTQRYVGTKIGTVIFSNFIT